MKTEKEWNNEEIFYNLITKVGHGFALYFGKHSVKNMWISSNGKVFISHTGYTESFENSSEYIRQRFLKAIKKHLGYKC